MVLNPLVSLFGGLVARSGRIRGTGQTDGRTDGQNDRTSSRVFEGIMRHQNTFLCNLGQKGEQNLKLGVNIS